MDQQKLRSLVFEKTGIKIDTSDPVFALVAMNEAVLEEAVQRHLLILEQSSKAISRQLHSLQVAGGLADAAQMPMQSQDDIWETSAAAQANQANSTSTEQANRSPQAHEGNETFTESATSAVADNPSKAQANLNLPIGNIATPQPRSLAADLRLAWMTSLFSAVLVLLGLATFGPKVPQISEIAQAAKMQGATSRLTPQQAAQIKQAEKLQSLLPKLDAKTRSQIEAELQKP